MDKGWTQQQLADVTSLSLRTIQRIENQGVASNETVNALCAVFAVERSEILTTEHATALDKTLKTIPLRVKLSYLFTFAVGSCFGFIISMFLL